jgi:hypothetical protein
VNLHEPINFKKEIEEELLERNGHSHTELDTTTFRASSVGYCPRQILLSKLGVKVQDAETQGKFQTGDFIHDWIQADILPKHPTMHENEVSIEVDGLTITGHYDCFDPVEGIVYDFKSRDGWYRFNPPVSRHLQQLEVYMRALNLQDPRGLMVYVSKGDLGVETYPDHFGISEEREDLNEQGDLLQPSEERWNSIVEKVSKVHEYLEEHGFPTSEEEVNAAFKPCGDCVGCYFEDSDKWDFTHVKQATRGENL